MDLHFTESRLDLEIKCIYMSVLARLLYKFFFADEQKSLDVKHRLYAYVFFCAF